MTLTDIPRPVPSSGHAASPSARRRRWGWSETAILLIATVGAVVLAYPAAASWFSAWSHDTEVDGYVQSLETLPDSERRELLDAAREYNENLPAGPLRDPYALGADGQQTAIGDGAAAYFDTLVTEGTDVMARVRIPRIHVDLPIYHGTSEETLAEGIGHLYGSSLPVGGPGTHSVLTGHNGFVQATLFDDIDELVPGDVIIVTTLGEDLSYEVDRTETVLPDETEMLRQKQGEDLLTLVTCTPTGVNTHRLLVQASRSDAPTDDDSIRAVADTTAPAGFPWWVLLVVGVPAITAFVVSPRRSPTPRRRSRTEAP